MPTKLATFVLIIFAWTVLCFLSRFIVGDLVALTALVLGEIVWFGMAYVKFVKDEHV